MAVTAAANCRHPFVSNKVVRDQAGRQQLVACIRSNASTFLLFKNTQKLLAAAIDLVLFNKAVSQVGRECK